MLSVAIVGCARSNRGNVWPDVHANGPSPQSREPLPEKALEVNGLNGTTMLAMPKVCPPSDELVKAAPAMVFPPWPKVPLNWANQETNTSPFGPIAMFRHWLLHTLLNFIVALIVASSSV